ncbi:hypothetical protein OR1_00776 [Geobacter sp. OR-1]|uniref:SlyX family protein n=1 Tax=Geobacter sp. OR-1 TaxID=1266765 RepID=UPI00054384B0|nr:SlyX family protein [Geobacter sp. OR-1]GAM08504.1 hypothetical protein OR1_00776 [Geobacter sp. OR-1]
MEERIIELETRYMHQEKTISELSEIVYRQELTIKRLETDIAMLRDQLSIALPALTRLPDEEEPPPHY